jgi:hypothetical protein
MINNDVVRQKKKYKTLKALYRAFLLWLYKKR